jgi:hypothetical protein
VHRIKFRGAPEMPERRDIFMRDRLQLRQWPANGKTRKMSECYIGVSTLKSICHEQSVFGDEMH